MDLLRSLLGKRSILFLVFTLIGACCVFAYIYFVGFDAPAERGSFFWPKLVVFLVLLLSLIYRFKKQGETEERR